MEIVGQDTGNQSFGEEVSGEEVEGTGSVISVERVHSLVGLGASEEHTLQLLHDAGYGIE